MDNIEYARNERRRQMQIKQNSTPVYRPSRRAVNIFWFSAVLLGIVGLIWVSLIKNS